MSKSLIKHSTQYAEWQDTVVHLKYAPCEVLRDTLTEQGAPQWFIQKHAPANAA